MLGGVQDLVRDGMKSEGIYNEFKDVLKVCLNSVLISYDQSADSDDSASIIWCLRM